MAKKFLFESIFNSLKAKFTKNEENIRLGLKYVEAIPQIGPKFDPKTSKIQLPEECTSVIVMFPGDTVDKYREIMSVWFRYRKNGREELEKFISFLDAVVTGWEEGRSVQGPTFGALRQSLNEIQDSYMRYWRRMEHEEEEYNEVLKNAECVNRRFMKLYGPSKEVNYGAILHTIIGKYQLVPKYPEMNLRADERISDRLRSLCITLSRSMDSVGIEDDDDDGFDRYRYEANQLLFFVNWYNNLLERDINFNIVVARIGAMTIPVKVYPKRDDDWKHL